MKEKANRLIHQTSPYLLQHAFNPIGWFPWGREAFELAEAEDKPIFLSIGYSTCHWCHVMAEESFQDEEVASLLNESFISIKVDREERPDVDSVYMAACLHMTGQGGWPLTLLLTPDKEPFFAATYLPKRAVTGGLGLMEVLEWARDQWRKAPKAIRGGAQRLARQLKAQYVQGSGRGEVSRELLGRAYAHLCRSFDARFGGAPKFPTPHKLLFLLRYSVQESQPQALAMAEKTLEGMAAGGVRDPLGGGFSRYATDEAWMVPHFEKMLYDNALLAMAYLEAYQLTGKEMYRGVGERVLGYLLREMRSGEGGFYTAQDADSLGEEGGFYRIRAQEAQAVLGEEDGRTFAKQFGLSGDWDIPHRHPAQPAGAHLTELARRMFAYRRGRTPLRTDDKQLTAMNALAVAALAKAYQILGEPKYLDVAQSCMAFIRQRLTREGRLLLWRREGQSGGVGTLDDYAYVLWALLELYAASFEEPYLRDALEVAKAMQEQFADAAGGGYFLTGKDAEQLVVRPKEVQDGALPSGNSVAAYALTKLARLTGRPEVEEAARAQAAFVAGTAQEDPSGHAFGLMALQFALYPTQELVAVLSGEEELPRVQALLRAKYAPNQVALVKRPGQPLAQDAPFLAPYSLLDGRSAYYLCQDFACQAPVTDLKELARQL